MAPGKQIPKLPLYRTKGEHLVLPIRYEGKFVRIDHKGVELDPAKFGYDASIHIAQALEAKELEIIKREDDK